MSSSPLVEVARGRLKPLSKCSGPERRRAERIEAAKAELIDRWCALIDDLGEDLVPRTALVMAVGHYGVGRGELPAGVTVVEWEAEVATLEAARDLRDKRRTEEGL